MKYYLYYVDKRKYKGLISSWGITIDGQGIVSFVVVGGDHRYLTIGSLKYVPELGFLFKIKKKAALLKVKRIELLNTPHSHLPGNFFMDINYISGYSRAELPVNKKPKRFLKIK